MTPKTKNPITVNNGKYVNTLTGNVLSFRYGRRLYNYFDKHDGGLSVARGHERVKKPKTVNLRIWSRDALRRIGIDI